MTTVALNSKITSIRVSGTDWALSFRERGGAPEIEARICEQVRELCPDYSGGMISYNALSNGGYFIAPECETIIVHSPNGCTETVSGEAAGVVATLFVLNRLDVRRWPSEAAMDHWHSTFGIHFAPGKFWEKLYDFAAVHPEGRAIFGLIA